MAFVKAVVDVVRAIAMYLICDVREGQSAVSMTPSVVPLIDDSSRTEKKRRAARRRALPIEIERLPCASVDMLNGRRPVGE